MNLASIITIAVGLAMDAFAVAVASGLTIKQLRLRHALRIGMYFGLFQAMMPAVGWLAGLSVRRYITGIDHWLVFAILAFIGGKMIYEAFTIKDAAQKADPLNLRVLLILALATSIDALAVGISFALLAIAIIAPILIIGGITFLISVAGVYIGDRIGHFFESRIEVVGGLVLIGIGVKILVEHLAG